jgi:hypothetical protein
MLLDFCRGMVAGGMGLQGKTVSSLRLQVLGCLEAEKAD